jgi:hypothetical protein
MRQLPDRPGAFGIAATIFALPKMICNAASGWIIRSRSTVFPRRASQLTGRLTAGALRLWCSLYEIPILAPLVDRMVDPLKSF